MLTKPDVIARVKYISSSDHYVDEAMKPKDVPQASFRKLNVD